MTTYDARNDLAQSPAVLDRVRMAVVEAALNVAAEAPSPDADLAAARRTLAAKVLRAPTAWAQVFVYGVVSNPNAGIGGQDDPTVGDGSLAYVVASTWNAYAAAAVTT